MPASPYTRPTTCRLPRCHHCTRDLPPATQPPTRTHLARGQHRVGHVPVVLEHIEGGVGGNGHQAAALAPVHAARRHVDAAHHLRAHGAWQRALGGSVGKNQYVFTGRLLARLLLLTLL